MSEKRFPEQEKMLLEAGLMAAEDTVLDSVAVNYVSPLIGPIGEWKKGWLYFTEERIVCPFSPPAQGGIVIPYAAITGLKTFSDGLVPGLDVQYTAPDGEPGILQCCAAGTGGWASSAQRPACSPTVNNP